MNFVQEQLNINFAEVFDQLCLVFEEILVECANYLKFHLNFHKLVMSSAHIVDCKMVEDKFSSQVSRFMQCDIVGEIFHEPGKEQKWSSMGT